MFSSCHGYSAYLWWALKGYQGSRQSGMEQLRFTARFSGGSDSLSAYFPPNPPPVELLGAVKGDAALSERLALAVRLARRDLQRSLARGKYRSHLSAQGVPQVEVMSLSRYSLHLWLSTVHRLNLNYLLTWSQGRLH